MADVYVLASPSPTLYIYPSQTHPQATIFSGPVWQPVPARRRIGDDDETVLAVLGVL